jgi:hypothetical protein
MTCPDRQACGAVHALHFDAPVTLSELRNRVVNKNYPNGGLAGSQLDFIVGLTGETAARRVSTDRTPHVVGGIVAVDEPFGYSLLTVNPTLAQHSKPT